VKLSLPITNPNPNPSQTFAMPTSEMAGHYRTDNVLADREDTAPRCSDSNITPEQIDSVHEDSLVDAVRPTSVQLHRSSPPRATTTTTTMT